MTPPINNRKLYETLGELREGMITVKQYIRDDLEWKKILTGEQADWREKTDHKIRYINSRITKIYWWAAGASFAFAALVALLKVL